MKGVFAELTGKNRFERLDFVILKTALMLATASIPGSSVTASPPCLLMGSDSFLCVNDIISA